MVPQKNARFECTRAVRRPAEQGFVLVTALIFVVVLTIIGLTSMQVASTQEKMAGSARDRAIALQAVEGTLRQGEVALLGVVPEEFTDTCADAKCSTGALPDVTDHSAWQTLNPKAVARSALESLVDPGLASDPEYLLEYAGTLKSPGKPGGWGHAYRVTGRSNGINGTTVVALQNVYRP